MNVQFTGVPPTSVEVERLRLLLSTYQDGTGQQVINQQGDTIPNWRDFERSVALAFKGIAQESKAVCDVIVPNQKPLERAFGISCKMRSEPRQIYSKGIIYVKVSNASGDFWNAVRQAGVYTTLEMGSNATEAGNAILGLVQTWHNSQKTYLDVAKSYYLVLQYDMNKLHYQLFQLPLELPDPLSLEWEVRYSKRKENSGSLIVDILSRLKTGRFLGYRTIVRVYLLS